VASSQQGVNLFCTDSKAIEQAANTTHHLTTRPQHIEQEHHKNYVRLPSNPPSTSIKLQRREWRNEHSSKKEAVLQFAISISSAQQEAIGMDFGSSCNLTLVLEKASAELAIGENAGETSLFSFPFDWEDWWS
jgi:hypothetical protein